MPRRQDDLAQTVLNWTGPRTPVTFNGRQRGYMIDLPNGRQYFVDDAEQRRLQQQQADHAGFRRMFNVARGVGIGLPAAAAVAPLIAGGAAAGAGGGAGAASGAGAAGYSSPGVYGGVFGGASGVGAAGVPAAVGGAASAGRLAGLSMGDLLKLGTGAGMELLGRRSQNRALDRQMAAERYGIDQQLAYAREQEEFRRAEAARVAAEDERRWNTEQANRERELQILMEDRARSQRLEDEDRGRREQARLTIGDLIRRGPQYIRRS